MPKDNKKDATIAAHIPNDGSKDIDKYIFAINITALTNTSFIL